MPLKSPEKLTIVSDEPTHAVISVFTIPDELELDTSDDMLATDDSEEETTEDEFAIIDELAVLLVTDGTLSFGFPPDPPPHATSKLVVIRRAVYIRRPFFILLASV